MLIGMMDKRAMEKPKRKKVKTRGGAGRIEGGWNLFVCLFIYIYSSIANRWITNTLE